MRINSKDKTIERNYIQKWQFLIAEYLSTKNGKHSKFRFVNDFYSFHNINRQTFCKYYNRYLNSGMDKDFLPRKRGPKWQSRRPDANIETQVLLERKKGLSKYEICLAPDFSLIFPPPLQPSGLAFFLGHYNKSVVFRYGLLLLEGVRCFVVRNIHNLINFLYIKANFRWNSVSFFSFFMS